MVLLFLLSALTMGSGTEGRQELSHFFNEKDNEKQDLRARHALGASGLQPVLRDRLLSLSTGVATSEELGPVQSAFLCPECRSRHCPTLGTPYSPEAES